MRNHLLLAAMAALAAATAHADCLDGRYLVAGDPLLPGTGGNGDAVVIANDTVAIASGCPAVPARIRRTARGTIVRAGWLQCGTVAGVRLRLRVNPSCSAAAGYVVTRRPPSRRRFVATKVSSCDGIAGVPCPDGHFCEHPAATCDVADQQGVCVPVPQACPDVYQPVCGCDGVTYSNDCDRQTAQAQKAHDGECTPKCDAACDCYRDAAFPSWCDALACPSCGCVWTCEKNACVIHIEAPVPDPGCS